jgi:4-diphosphocytidyl-2-C-methyl-D-erythritol kinase
MITIARAEGVDWDPLKDLCAKAYYILAEDFQLPPVKIFLEKTSPVGAGLGGGSSDAAFALRMLNEICGLGLDEQKLATYAARLGSDCAFFIYNRPMIGEGRGEVLTPYELEGFDFGPEGMVSSRYDLQVLTPEGVAVSTADAYRGIKPHLPEVPLREALAKPVEQWQNVLFNDFEETVFAKYPELAAIKKSLYDSGAVYACMSGSGSALFALYEK